MKKETRIELNAFLDRQAELNGEDAATVRAEKSFSIDPSVQQKLIDRQQEDSAFLGEINIVPVDEMKGEVLGLGVSGPLASRTNTTTTDRATTDPTGLDQDGYECKQTNSDTHVTYAKLDAWAKFPDFQTRLSNAIIKRQALDRIMVGFNGVSAAPQTDKAANPLLQDVNIGWLEKYRQYQDGARVLDSGSKTEGKILIGADKATTDYRNINALVADAIHGLMPSWARNDADLVAILGDDLLHDTFFPLINKDHAPSELLAGDLVLSAKRVGGKKAAAVPFMLPKAIFITRLDNLSIYEQDGKRRRTVVDNAKRNRIETYESSNDAFVVEDFDYGCLIENVEFA